MVATCLKDVVEDAGLFRAASATVEPDLADEREPGEQRTKPVGVVGRPGRGHARMEPECPSQNGVLSVCDVLSFVKATGHGEDLCFAKARQLGFGDVGCDVGVAVECRALGR